MMIFVLILGLSCAMLHADMSHVSVLIFMVELMLIDLLYDFLFYESNQHDL